MAKCGICGKDIGLFEVSLKLRKDKTQICNECFKKAGGLLGGHVLNSLDDVRKAIESTELAKQNDMKVAQEEAVGAIYNLKGARGREMIVYENKVLLRVKATLGSFITGNFSDGEKTIYFKDCIGIQFKKCDLQLGYLQFETAGMMMNNSTSNFFNENTFTFDSPAPNPSNELMIEVANYVKKQIELCKQEKPIGTTVSAADEILKFKNLLDLGVITQEEFDEKKKKLLGL